MCINNSTQEVLTGYKETILTMKIIRNWNGLHGDAVECLFPGISKIWLGQSPEQPALNSV